MKKSKKQGPLRTIKSVFKGTVRNTTILVMSTALVTYPLDFPYVNAFFTDKIIYSKDSSISGKRTFTTMNNRIVQLYFDIHRFDKLNVDFDVRFADDILIAAMNLPDDCGFNAADIIINSLEISYDNEIIDLSPLDVETSGKHIQLKYDWSLIEKFIDSDDHTPAFDISGKGEGMGKSGLGEKFVFRGAGRTADLQKEFFEQMDFSYFIRGRESIIIPTIEEESQVFSYTFYIDDKEIPADEVEWELSAEISGVKFESGELIDDSDAEAGNITLIATLKSNKYFTYELDIELIKIEEEIVEEIIEEIVEEPEEVLDVGEIEDDQSDKVLGFDQGDPEKEEITVPVDPPENKLNDDKDKDEDDNEDDSGDGNNNEDNSEDETDTENEDTGDEENEDYEDETTDDEDGEDDTTDDEDISEDEEDTSTEDDVDGSEDDGSEDDINEDEESSDDEVEDEEDGEVEDETNSDGNEDDENEYTSEDENDAENEETTDDEDLDKDSDGQAGEDKDEDPVEESDGSQDEDSVDKQEKADRDMDDGNETKIEKDTDTDSDKTVDKITKEDNSNDGNSNEDITDSSDRTIIKGLLTL